jgi:cellulose synthase operon protein C
MKSQIRSSTFKLVLVALVMALTANVSAKTKKNPDSGLKQLNLKSGDERGNDIKALKTEMLIAQTEEKAIAQTEKLIKKYKGTPLEADLLLRQAELFMRRAKTDRFLEIQRKSDDMVQLAPRLIKSAQSKVHVSKAIAVYDQIEKRFPDFERLDQAIFNNAFASQQLADQKKSERLFLKFISDFPSSSLITDENLAAGEMRFQRREFAEALKHFQAIKNFPDSNVYPYGLYKAAWTHYNMRDGITALKELEAVVQYGRFVKEQGIDARLDLRKEALGDMTLFYEEVLPAKNAYS